MDNNLALHSNKTNFRVVCSILKNIVNNPFNPKYRSIKLSNPKLQEVLKQKEAFEILSIAGFKKDDEKIYFPSEGSVDLLKKLVSQMESIANSETKTKPLENLDPNLLQDETFQTTINMTNLLNANERVKQNPNDTQALLELARCIDRMEIERELPRAIEICKTILRIEKNKPDSDPKILFHANKIYASSLYKLKRITEAYKQLHECRVYFQFVDKKEQSLFHCLVGCVHVAMKQPERAIVHFDKAIELDPSNTHLIRQRCNAVTNLAMLDAVIGNIDSCISQLQQCLKDCPGHEQSLLSLGLIYSKIGDTENAIKYFVELVHRPATNYDGINFARKVAYDQVSDLFVKTGRWKEKADLDAYWKDHQI